MTRMLQNARTALLATLVAAATLTGCGGDTTEPDVPFNPTGTAEDLNAADAAFASAELESFTSLSTGFSAALGSSAAAVTTGPSTARAGIAGQDGVRATARRLAEQWRSRTAGAANFNAASVPDAALGVTFAINPETGQYEATDLAGAPSSGVRFILYAVNPLTGWAATPLNEVGYADIIDESTASQIRVRVNVVGNDNVTYVNYLVTGSETSTGAALGIAGFVTNGTTRADFDLGFSVTASSESFDITVDYELAVPSRDFALDYRFVLGGDEAAGEFTVTLDMALDGQNGRVDLDGTFTIVTSGETVTESGQIVVRVNGEQFAVISGQFDAATPTITAPGGGALSAEDEETVRRIFDGFAESQAVVDELTAPVFPFIG